MEAERLFLKSYTAKARLALHRAARCLRAKRNGVVSFLSAAPAGRGRLEVHVRNTRPDSVNVSRKFLIGPRGGISVERPNYRRYFKAAQLGKGSL